jgi:agmatine deiminase
VSAPLPPTAPAFLPRELGLSFPAEWEPHAATWLAWPHNPDDWPGVFERVPDVFHAMVRELSSGERVRLIVGSEAERSRVAALLERDVDLTQVDFYVHPTNRSWTRDFVPTFVKGKGPVGLAAVKFAFDGWARYADHADDDEAGRRVPGWLGVARFEPTVPSAEGRRRIVLEGGGLDTDGQGTLLVTEECLVTGPRARNAWLGREGTEAVLRDYLGVERVIWLTKGIAGDDTSGHVDDFARFVAPGRVVLAKEDGASDPNHGVLLENRRRLEDSTDARGRRIEVVDLPMPEARYHEGDRLPASYANFYVANGLVLVPTFEDPADESALGILSEVFPGRRVVGIPSSDLVVGLGAIHCSTQQEPLAGP